MRHAREIGDHRLTTDVLAERQRQRRLQLVVRLRLHDLAERHDLADLVRDLEADERLAGNDLDDAHADRRERPCEVFRKAADLAALDAGGRLQLEARNDGPRVHGHDLGLDAEVVELELHEPRHRFERFRRVAALFRRRIVEQRQCRQLVRRRRLEHRHLSLALETLGRAWADFDFLDDGLDARRRLRLGANFADDFVALLLGAAAFPPDARVAEPLIQRREAPIHDAPRAIHDRDPRDAGRELHGCEPQHEQQHRRAEQTQSVFETLADDAAKDAAGRLAHLRRLKVQRRKPGARRDRQQEARAAPDDGPFLRQLFAAKQEYARDQHEDRKQIGRGTEQQEPEIGEPSPGGAHAVRHGVIAARDAERGVHGAVAQERQ
jgi:hypothetical protein